MAGEQRCGSCGAAILSGEALRDWQGLLWMSHFATCPHAARHRKAR